MGYREYHDPRDHDARMADDMHVDEYGEEPPAFLDDPEHAYEDMHGDEGVPYEAQTRGEVMGRPDMAHHPGRSVDRESMSTMFEATGRIPEDISEGIEREPKED